MSTPTYTKTGTKAATAVKLDSSIFGLDVQDHTLLKEAYLTYLANGRVNLAKTKKRGEVRGGGRKPWRQKGTGRARFGSSRNPLWRGGGIAFGPSGNENYSRKLSVSMKRQALRQALSTAASSDKIKVVESIDMSGKTKDFATLLTKIESTGNVLCVVDEKNETKELAARNLSNVHVCSAKYLNTYDVLNADVIVISKSSLEAITQWLGATK